MKFILYILTLLLILSCQKDNTVKEAELKQIPSCFTDLSELCFNQGNISNSRPDKNSPYPPPRGNYSCIYIDFDGEIVSTPSWNNGDTLYCSPSGLSTEQQEGVVARVRATFYPFKVYVTDSLSYFQDANRYKRIRVIVTPTSYWRPLVGGVAFYNSFTWGNETPAFVFSDRLLFSEHYVAELVCHETGHTMNLAHQSLWDNNCNMTVPLTPGVIMGNSLSVPFGEWTYGTTPNGCTIFQDDSLMLKNKLGLR